MTRALHPLPPLTRTLLVALVVAGTVAPGSAEPRALRAGIRNGAGWLARRDALHERAHGKLSSALAPPSDHEGAAGGPGLGPKPAPALVEMRMNSLTPGLVTRLEEMGMNVASVHMRYARVVGSATADALEAMAGLPEVTDILPLYPGVRQVGGVTSQADGSIAADRARADFGVDGSGVRVGVLSDSFKVLAAGSVAGDGCERNASLSAGQVWGDLPDHVFVIREGPAGSTDEGRAMAELIYDLAPGATLLFHTAQGGEAVFADGIRRLAECGADVIVDDIIYFVEPMFQDGIVGAAAAEVVRDGRSFFSAAGNNGVFGVDDFYRDSSPTTSGDLGSDFHDFGQGQPLAGFRLPAGCDATFILQWNEPFDGILGPGAQTDLDVFLLQCDGDDCSAVSGSTSAQGCSRDGGGGDPLEIATIMNPTDAPRDVFLAVDRACGADVRFRVATFGSCSLQSYEFDQSVFSRPQVYGHAAAEGVNAVAAVPFFEIDSGGNSVGTADRIDVEGFSSLGGMLDFYFDASGNPLPDAPVARFKPEMAAPDGTNTTFFGGDLGFDPDRYPNFFGTSAAAPHGAAVAALMLQRNPGLDPAAVTSRLRSTALDIQTEGLDDRAGSGLIDAPGAVGAAGTP